MRNALLATGLLLAACSQPAPTPDAANSLASAGSVDRPPGNETAPNSADMNSADTNSVDTNSASSTPVAAEADYLGRWVGVEGMFLNVTSRSGGGVTLEMQWDLDHKGTFDGTVTPAGLRFTRDGKTETAVPSDGDATGLKYLAGKQHCLTVKPGEGYCRAG